MSTEVGNRILVTGTCIREGCGKFSKITIGNEEDAQDMLNHAHGHCFEGEIKVSEQSRPKLVEEAA